MEAPQTKGANLFLIYSHHLCLRTLVGEGGHSAPPGHSGAQAWGGPVSAQAPSPEGKEVVP